MTGERTSSVLKGSTIRLREERREKRSGEGREGKEARGDGLGRRKKQGKWEDIRETGARKRGMKEKIGGENKHRMFQDKFPA